MTAADGRDVDGDAGIDSERGPVQYHLRDVTRLPGLLSLARVPLAALFPVAAATPRAGLGVLAAAGVTDVLDGYAARRLGQATPTGAALDPVTDKLFVATALGTLVARGDLGLRDLALLVTRDVAELPLAIAIALAPAAARERAEAPVANAFGKAATALQFAAVAAIVARSRHAHTLVLLAAGAGAAAAISYWRRALADGGVLAAIRAPA